MTSTTPAPIGVVAHYNLLERLEPAGPGELYRARDTKLGRTVAVRVLPEEFFPDSRNRASLIETARSLGKLSHPNVMTLFDVGYHEGRVYLAFEFLKGQSLRAEAAGRPMNVRRSIEIAIQIADAVADAHAHGFAHGGLSPESVVITARGHAKVPAFDLATRGGFEDVDGATRLRDYESPEEARGEPPDDRSDIYSIGAILYEMLTTRRPMHRGASAPSSANSKVPKPVDDVVLRALSPNPESRPQSAATFAGELRALIPLLDTLGVPGEEETEVVTRSGGIGSIVGLAAVMLLVLVAIVWWFTRR